MKLTKPLTVARIAELYRVDEALLRAQVPAGRIHDDVVESGTDLTQVIRRLQETAPDALAMKTVFSTKPESRGALHWDATLKAQEYFGRMLLELAQPTEVNALVSAYYVMKDKKTVVDRKSKESPDEVVVTEVLTAAFVDSSDKTKRKIFAAMRSGQIPTARKGQSGSSWAVRAGELYQWAMQNDAALKPSHLGLIYKSLDDARTFLSSDTIEKILSRFDGYEPLPS